MTIIIDMMFIPLLFYFAIVDWKKRVIPNKVILPALLVAFVLRWILGDLSYTDSILGFLLAGGAFFIGAWTGSVGGGDMKLMALVGFILGLDRVLLVLLILCLLLLITWIIKRNEPVPFAPYVCLAVIFIYMI